jgi:DNA-binding transcriptional ArsR family regulator
LSTRASTTPSGWGPGGRRFKYCLPDFEKALETVLFCCAGELASKPQTVGTPRAALTYNHVVVDNVDRLFSGLADPTRRDILRRCAIDAPSVSRLAEAYPMSFAAVQKHVAVLERAGLVAKERRGRETLVRTEVAAVARARRALDELEDLWRGRVDRMSEVLSEEGNPQ